MLEIGIPPGEARILIKLYLSLGNIIDRLEQAKRDVSSSFYASRSMTGVACYDRERLTDFQTGVSPETAAIKIISREQAIQKQIDRLKPRFDNFDKLTRNLKKPCINSPCYAQVTGKDIIDTETYQFEQPLSQEEDRLIKVIKQIECNIRSEERLKGFGLNEEQQAQMADVGSQLLNRIKELAL